MKKLIYLLVAPVLFIQGGCCVQPEIKHVDILYTHKILSYIELKQGMQLFIKEGVDYNNRGRFGPDPEAITTFSFFYHRHEDCSPEYMILPYDMLKANLYPGTIKLQEDRFPIYDSIYNRSRYEEIAKEMGDSIHKKFFTGFGSAGPLGDLDLYYVALYNKLDSIKIICLDEDIEDYPKGSSLNDIVNVNFTFLKKDSDGEYKGKRMKCLLKDFYTQVGRETGLISAYSKYYYYDGNVYAPCLPSVEDWRINNSGPINFYLDNPLPAGSYTFKLYFYLDDGALTVESNAFTVKK